jgi:hypothetical protein
MRKLRAKQVFFAYDTPDDLEPLREAGRIMLDAGFTRASHSLRCYVLCGWPKDTEAQADVRMSEAMAAGFTPMAMAFHGRDGQSIKGDKGEPGRDGVDGKSIRGEKGDQGEKGDRGEDGADGIGVATAYVSDAGYLVIELTDGKKITAGYVRGRDGKNGKATIIYGGAGASSGGGGGGEPGPPGADGASAYEVAVENGFVGTVEQWLASLVGPKGDKGDKGDTGDTGPAGTPNKGTATLAFGAAPGTNVVTVNVTGQTGITSAAQPKAWFAADTTADHNSYEHAIMFPARIGLACGDVINGVGFTIYASTELRLTGNVTCRWEWS